MEGLGGTMMEFFTIDIAIFFSTTDLTSNRKYFKNSKRFFRVDFERREEGGERRGGSIFNFFPFSAPDVELECLATWKESSTHNLVARLHAPRKTSDEDSYRCFIYEQTSNNSWNLAQSEDASCTGLISVKEAAKTFKMKQSE